MKLFQIEEPDGTPAEAEGPGAAIGIDCCGANAEVALAVGGNAVLLTDRPGFEQVLRAPAPTADRAAWQALFEGAQLRAERALARPVTHAVLALPGMPEGDHRVRLEQAAEAAGMVLLDLVARDVLTPEVAPALAVAILAEDRAPPPADPSAGA